MFVCVVFPMKTLLRGYPRVSARRFNCWSNVLDVGLEFYRGCVDEPFLIKTKSYWYSTRPSVRMVPR